jgi:hypothetical protein
MKKYILVILVALVASAGYGQKSSKYVSDTLKVYGNCDMCEERIENACDVVGVKRADWNEETSMLSVTYNPSKISLEEIHQICADIGHATSKVQADEEAYENLHHCCKYVIHEHEEGEHEHGDEAGCEGKCGASCTKKK